jgi:hypothetical protein
MQNYDAQYRARAAEGLGAIGGKDATEGLELGLKLNLRQDVRLTLQKALDASKRSNKR